MKKPCATCQQPTNRHDGLCPNCYFIRPESDNPQSIMEALVIETNSFTCACGEDRTRVLLLVCKGGPNLQAGYIKSDRPGPRDRRALMASEDPSYWFVICCNCYRDLNQRSPGRPKKYTDEERKWARTNYPKIYRANLNSKVVKSYGIGGQWPECVSCMLPATRVLYIGEFGKAPLGNQYWYCRKLSLTDPSWHSQFAPYCEYHEVMNIGQRNHERKRIQAEQLVETLFKSSRSLQELEPS